ncbi:MAG: Hsp20/alpha crystallin family protein [Butyrivibrio sp.]|nr:Hsp20/alpha crystallin family protein [Muribaculum sp.]MCM1552801.1 Hsp20/alpha crystallin family protein [Butyrivibrio sp.]
MLLPSASGWNSLFGRNMLDDFFGMPFGSNTSEMMSTDVRETEDGYEVVMNLPGFAKEDVKGEVKDGYLTISASTSSSNDSQDEGGKYIRRERYCGSCSRSFYVGDAVTQEDIKARFENGTLQLQIPKKEATRKIEDRHYIAID